MSLLVEPVGVDVDAEGSASFGNAGASTRNAGCRALLPVLGVALGARTRVASEAAREAITGVVDAVDAVATAPVVVATAVRVGIGVDICVLDRVAEVRFVVRHGVRSRNGDDGQEAGNDCGSSDDTDFVHGCLSFGPSSRNLVFLILMYCILVEQESPVGSQRSAVRGRSVGSGGDSGVRGADGDRLP